VKKPQQANSSQPDSPCDTVSMVNEFGDVELPNLNSIANSSGHSFMNADLSNNSVNTNMNLAMNWAVASEVQVQVPSLTSLPWPSGLLSPSISSVNSLLLKALQLRNYQQREAAAVATDHFAPFMGEGLSQVGTELSSNLTASSSSKVQECLPQQQLQQQQEQPFNLDSIW